jgi:hypothetical protein
MFNNFLGSSIAITKEGEIQDAVIDECEHRFRHRQVEGKSSNTPKTDLTEAMMVEPIRNRNLGPIYQHP